VLEAPARNPGDQQLEAYREPGERSVLEHVVFVLSTASTLFVVDVEQSISQKAGVGHTALRANFKAIGGNHIPGELAAGAKATDVTAQHQLLTWRQLVPDPAADERVDELMQSPVRGTCHVNADRGTYLS
jgi:hypothetical protein